MTAAKRFWKSTTVAEVDDGFAIHLDGRVVKTPEGAVLTIPNQHLANSIRDEWDAQEETIDPATMPMFRFTVTAVDRVTPQREAVIDEISNYGSSDLLCYREADDQALARHQHNTWQPYLEWFAKAEGVSLICTDGLMPITQDAGACTTMRGIVARYDDFTLAGLHTLVTVSGSLVIGLAMATGEVTPETGGAAALLDDLWQQDKWGYDAEADARIKANQNLLTESCRFIDMLQK